MTATTLREKERKQDRARARRKLSDKTTRRKVRELDSLISEVYKDIEEWDDEELARGRPRAYDGSFRGGTPKWVSAKVHEEAVKRFKDLSQADLRGLVPRAIQVVENLIMDEEVDERGRYRVPPSVKLQAAQWVVEHLLGKPTQRIEADISVRLQAILGNVLVQPGDLEGQVPALMEAESWEGDEEEPGE